MSMSAPRTRCAASSMAGAAISRCCSPPGRTPYSEEGGLPGMRSGEIHWPQEMRDQRAMVREFVKWDYELPNGEVLESAVDRALNIAMTEPRGPVYMTLPRETLAAPIKNFRYASPSRHRDAVTRPIRIRNAIDEAADLLAHAEFPLIITRSGGRVRIRRAEARRARRALRHSGVRAQEPGTCACRRTARCTSAAIRKPISTTADVIVVLECRCAVDSQAQEIAAAGGEDHPYRRRSDLRELPVARLSLRSRDHRAHRRDASVAERSAGIPREARRHHASMPGANGSRSRTRS